MKWVVDGISALAFLVGLGCVGYGALTPILTPLSGASAIQVTQVYSQADHYVLLGIAAFVFGILIVVLDAPDKER